MQQLPGGSVNLSRGTVLKIVAAVIIIGAITFLIRINFGTDWAWIFVLFVLLNTYFGWRAYSANKESPRRDMQNLETFKPEKFSPDESATVEGQQEAYQNIQDPYEECPNCGEELVPGLNYCEECGEEVK